MEARSAYDVPSTQTEVALLPTITALAAGVIAAICAFLPWITAQTSYQDANGYTTTTSFSWSGFDGQILDGWYAPALGGAVALIGLAALIRCSEVRQAQGIGDILAAAVLIAVSARNIAAVSAVSSSSALQWLRGYVSIGAGAGLWLMLAAAIVLAVAGFARLVTGDAWVLQQAHAWQPSGSAQSWGGTAGWPRPPEDAGGSASGPMQPWMGRPSGALSQDEMEHLLHPRSVGSGRASSDQSSSWPAPPKEQ